MKTTSDVGDVLWSLMGVRDFHKGSSWPISIEGIPGKVMVKVDFAAHEVVLYADHNDPAISSTVLNGTEPELKAHSDLGGGIQTNKPKTP